MSLTGKIKWYNSKKGYGFVERDDKEKDVFILGCGGPVVTVALEEHHFVVFKKITFMHTGANFNTKFKESATQ